MAGERILCAVAHAYRVGSGGPVQTAWVTAALEAHDIKPEWKTYGWTALTPACNEQFKHITLHWHDLRHEYASRLVEKGVPLAQVRDLLGHASIITTERCDNQKLENLQAGAARLETGKSFDPSPQKPRHRQSVKLLSRIRLSSHSLMLQSVDRKPRLSRRMIRS